MHEDLFQAGCVGLIYAVDHYDPKKGCKFSSYARDMIKYSMIACLRDYTWPVSCERDMKEQLVTFENRESQLMKVFAKESVVNETAQYFGMDERSTLELMMARQSKETVSLESQVRHGGYDGGESETYEDVIGQDDPGYEMACDRICDEADIAGMIEILNPCEQRIVSEHYLLNKDFKQIASELHKKSPAVQVACSRAIIKLRKEFSPEVYRQRIRPDSSGR